MAESKFEQAIRRPEAYRDQQRLGEEDLPRPRCSPDQMKSEPAPPRDGNKLWRLFEIAWVAV